MSLDGHPKPAVTADVVCVTHTDDGDPSVLLIRPRNDPFRDHWAVPGGFVAADETIEQAAARELREETHLDLDDAAAAEPLGVWSRPGRDPRGWVISICHLAHFDQPLPVTAGDDARNAKWVAFSTLNPTKLAFDHQEMLELAHLTSLVATWPPTDTPHRPA